MRKWTDKMTKESGVKIMKMWEVGSYTSFLV